MSLITLPNPENPIRLPMGLSCRPKAECRGTRGILYLGGIAVGVFLEECGQAFQKKSRAVIATPSKIPKFHPKPPKFG